MSICIKEGYCDESIINDLKKEKDVWEKRVGELKGLLQESELKLAKINRIIDVMQHS